VVQAETTRANWTLTSGERSDFLADGAVIVAVSQVSDVDGPGYAGEIAFA
jgi:hypothetical protein